LTGGEIMMSQDEKDCDTGHADIYTPVCACMAASIHRPQTQR